MATVLMIQSCCISTSFRLATLLCTARAGTAANPIGGPTDEAARAHGVTRARSSIRAQHTQQNQRKRRRALPANIARAMWSPWTPAALAATFAGALAGQEPGQPATTPPATGSTTTSADVPAPLPDGAPPQMAQIDRVDLKKHAYWLADDARQGRFTSSKSQFEVANYIAQQFQKLGLKPLGDKKGYLQLYPLDKTFIDTAATSLLFGSDKITANYAVLPASDGDKVLLGGHFAFCGNGS